jgi:hypothetical protein
MLLANELIEILRAHPGRKRFGRFQPLFLIFSE